MTGHDDEFDDFLSRRRKLFRGPEQDVLEPPEDVDRIVLRQAREAIEMRSGPREIRGLAWGAPLALAATLLVVFTMVLNLGTSKKQAVPQVTVEQVAQRRDVTPAPTAPPTTTSAPAGQLAGSGTNDNSPRIPGLVSEDEASRYAPPPPAAPVAARDRGAAAESATADAAAEPAAVIAASPPPSEAERAVARSSGSGTPAWRRDSGSWLAEIQRLRAEGKTAEADAELAEYKRQHKAYAGSPDR